MSTTRGKVDHEKFVASISGTAHVKLPQIPTSPILVVAAIEDQRYAGAAVIEPDGMPGRVPDGVGEAETHVRRSFERDVRPLLHDQCGACHNPSGPDNAGFYMLTGTQDQIVNDNYGLTEQKAKCKTANPNDADALQTCIDAISSAEFLVEPGAPAVSNLLVRARPDEDAGTSTAGLAWYGSKGSRYSMTYGDRRMPSTTFSTDSADWTNAPTYFDSHADEYQVLFDWVAQGALP